MTTSASCPQCYIRRRAEVNAAFSQNAGTSAFRAVALGCGQKRVYHGIRDLRKPPRHQEARCMPSARLRSMRLRMNFARIDVSRIHEKFRHGASLRNRDVLAVRRRCARSQKPYQTDFGDDAGSDHLQEAALNQLAAGYRFVLRREKAVDRVAEVSGKCPFSTISEIFCFAQATSRAFPMRSMSNKARSP